MARVLLDTNILVYLADALSPRHTPAESAFTGLLQSGAKLVLASQVV